MNESPTACRRDWPGRMPGSRKACGQMAAHVVDGVPICGAHYLDELKRRLCAAEADLATARSELTREQGQRRSIGLILDAAKYELARLRKIIHDAYGYLPTTSNALAFVDFDIVPHARAVADEFAVLREQITAFERSDARRRDENARLRETLEGLNAAVCGVAGFRDLTFGAGDTASMRVKFMETVALDNALIEASAALAPQPAEKGDRDEA